MHWRDIKRLLVGKPLETLQLGTERLNKVVGLAVLSSDALSSVAYATEAMLLVLMAAGAAGTDQALKVGGFILLLLVIVVASYRQTVDRKSTRLNSSHSQNSNAVFCLKNKDPCCRERNFSEPRLPFVEKRSSGRPLRGWPSFHHLLRFPAHICYAHHAGRSSECGHRHTGFRTGS